MQLKIDQIEELLNQEEGPALDFKHSQYQFKRSSSPEKTEDRRSELVKDILAFANAKRSTPGYILIGVKEVKGSRSKIVGISEHLVDNDLHDFMSRRTQRPIEFSYTPYLIDGAKIGVIEIPAQDGIFFLTNSYGSLHQNLVYIRDGSSTRIADPYEIAEMLTPNTPSFELNLIDKYSRGMSSPSCKVQSLMLDPLLPADEIQTEGPPGHNFLSLPSLENYNSNYAVELIIYTFHQCFCQPLRLRIHNTSDVTGKKIRFETSIMKGQNILVMSSLPELPREYSNPLLHSRIPKIYHRDDITIELSENDESWEIIVEFENVRPGEKVLTDDELWIGSAITQNFTVNGKILGENIPNPIPCPLLIEFQTQKRPMTLQDVEIAEAQG